MRVHEHKIDILPGFSRKYAVYRLVWYEEYPTAQEEVAREKDIMTWRRDLKVRLIAERNRLWMDLYPLLAR